MRGECPNPQPDCKYAALGGCFSDLHHEVFPRREYRTKLEKAFREHVLKKIVLCRAVHDELHATTPPPVKPSHEEMELFLEVNHGNSSRSTI